MRMKQSAVAGLFYPDDPVELRAAVDALLRNNPSAGACPRAVLVPHAGLVYSGAIAALAYNRCKPCIDLFQRIVLLGPSHRFPLQGVAALDADEWQTPSGIVEIDRRYSDHLVQSTLVGYQNQAHIQEHSLEVQLPFLQSIAAHIPVVALAVGKTPLSESAALLLALLEDKDNLVLVSSDLSHFHDYSSARMLDQLTMDCISQRQATLLPEQACGCYAVNGLLAAADQLSLQAEQLGACNSGDSGGDHHRVVGYASYAFV